LNKKNKKNKTKTKTKTRRRHYRGGAAQCPRSKCGSYEVECDDKKDTCHCLTCGITTPSKFFTGPAGDYGVWVQSPEARKWVEETRYSDLIFR